MSSTDKGIKEKGWEKVQIKAFTSWLNGYLSKRDMEVNDIRTDMGEGVRLINFLELLSNKRVKQKYVEKPPSRIQCIQNLHIALTFLEKEMGVKNIGTSAENFADHNLTLILGFFWTLFKKFRIQTIKHEDKSSEAGLLSWVKKTTEGYEGVNIESYNHSFRNGLAFLALCDNFCEDPEKCDFSQYSKENQEENLTAAFEIAEKEIGIPKLLEAKEVAAGDVDERSLVLYISLYFHAFVAKEQKKGLLEEKERMEGEMQGMKGTLQERAQMAAQLKEENDRLHAEIDELKKKLEEEKEEREKLEQLLAESKEKGEQLEGAKIQLEGQVNGLEGAVQEWSSKFKEVSEEKEKETELNKKRNLNEINGLSVLKKNLEEHLEDLNRWRNYLDIDPGDIDWAGDIRPQLLLDIKGEEFEEQLSILSKKLASENEELDKVLKEKEAEKNAKKEMEKKKKERQKKQAKA